MVPNQLSIFYQAMPQLADRLQSLDARNEQRVRELQMSIDHSLEQHSTQSQQQLWQLFAFSSLTFRLESLPASQYVSAQISVAATPLAVTPLAVTPLARSPSPSPLGLEPPKYKMCRTVKTVEALWHEWTVGL